ncbi:2-iminoacetate synthase ThiH [Candidatus Desulfovibrio trichonymphae]|uniref:2-iminoacetate synthase n=1 Tax=Candidatus Desulfovibrio trichonymphae TaxID=1725232 RepID=A0A1J1DWP6_9BACT|nr:2-iminoacetate synthase ThiH [Candidatus Desulfovibrio trichonymphae]BAV91526.1 2-iminoacetate synthase [Candidatus Desulfovibrio trichonymphae]GHU93275.1 thiamine biosynthesis protein ThiH [Deltaproteobacteria bacterium]
MESFQEFLQTWPAARRADGAAEATPQSVLSVLDKEILQPEDFLTLLSPAAAPYLENMARRAHELTLRYFGRAVQLFSPLYISDICTNQCRYCGFNARNKQPRRHLTVHEAEAEAGVIADMGMQHILLLTGDARKVSSPEYIADVVRRIKPRFASIGIEVYAMTEEEYALMSAAGVDCMTMFQETYTPGLYDWLHPAGPKRDYAFRLAAPERAARAGMYSLGIGALLGLENFEQDAFAVGLHAWWLQRRFPGVEVGVSVPRICPHEGEFATRHIVDDRHFVQYVVATRCFLPRVGITCSTRENAFMRDHLVPLGVTRVSAGVSTAVGGRATKDSRNPGQFEIADHRGVKEMTTALAGIGYQTVLKDWEDSTADMTS